MIKYSMRGEVEWQIQHKAECCICNETSPPSAVFYRTTRVYSAFTDLLVLHGRTD